MIDELLGLPAHPLIVHAAVVFGPLLVASVLVYALIPGLRSRLAWIVVTLAVVAPGALLLAKQSGESFLARQKAAGAAGEFLEKLNAHQDLGAQAAWWGIGLGALALILVYLGSAADRKPATSGMKALLYAVTAASVLVAGVVGYFVLRAGHTGASAVWG